MIKQFSINNKQRRKLFECAVWQDGHIIVLARQQENYKMVVNSKDKN